MVRLIYNAVLANCDRFHVAISLKYKVQSVCVKNGSSGVLASLAFPEHIMSGRDGWGSNRPGKGGPRSAQELAGDRLMEPGFTSWRFKLLSRIRTSWQNLDCLTGCPQDLAGDAARLELMEV